MLLPCSLSKEVHTGWHQRVFLLETAPEASFPKDAVDEWPEAKKFHSVYIAKYRTVEDQNVKAKLEQADKELKKLNQARDPITEKGRCLDRLLSLNKLVHKEKLSTRFTCVKGFACE